MVITHLRGRASGKRNRYQYDHSGLTALKKGSCVNQFSSVMQVIVGSVFLFGNARRCDSRGTLAASGVGPKAGSDAGNLTRLNAATDSPNELALNT